MSLVPADGFFLPQPKEQLSQGDIVVAPTTTLWSEAGRGILVGPQPPHFLSELGAVIRGELWKVQRNNMANYATHSTRRGLAVVVSHDCLLDKQFNELVTQLLKAGASLEKAQQIAAERPDLDESVLISPLLLLAEIPSAYHSGIQQRIGYFPLPPIPGYGDRDFVVDLSQVTTVDWRLLPDTRISLSEESVNRLRFKLAEMFAYRGLSSLGQLTSIIGQRISDVKILEQSKKKSRLILTLEDGSSRAVEIKSPEADAETEAEVVRPAGTRRQPRIVRRSQDDGFFRRALRRLGLDRFIR